jgi:D-arabinose 1-dehydrogenase-like Zn-dependent alcohol dehydrogenase
MTMKAARFHHIGADYSLDEIPIPTPGPREVLIKVHASSICHGDNVAKYGVYPGMQYPLTPGHEVVGVVEQRGSDVTIVNVGDRIGAGWSAGHCHTCETCRDGDFTMCRKGGIHGTYQQGGFAEYMIVKEEACAKIPEEIDSEHAAPILCAGLTCYTALRDHPAPIGSICAVQGIGGLGHMAIQYANKLGYRVVAISRGKDKEALAMELGAHIYIDSAEVNAVEKLKELGGAALIICTAPNSQAIAEISLGAKRNGNIVIVAAPHDPIPLDAGILLSNRVSVHFHVSGNSKDSEEALNFSAFHNVRPLIEIFTLDQIEKGHGVMMDGSVKFRAVVKFDH